MRLAGVNTGTLGIAAAIVEKTEVLLIDCSTEDKPGRLFPGSTAAALVEDDLMYGGELQDITPLRSIKTTTSCRIFKAPRDIFINAHSDQSQRQSHELITQTQRFSVMLGDGVTRMWVSPRILLVPYIIRPVPRKAETCTRCREANTFNSSTLEKSPQTFLHARSTKVIFVAPLRVPDDRPKTLSPQSLGHTTRASKKIKEEEPFLL